ncbi:MAG: hypothetical protein GY754_09340, partial [bacterium]|nr:hypothetical protein [bacterium]
MYNKLSKFLFLLLFLLFPLTVMNCWGEKEVSGEYVSIINKGTYYAVTFDFSKNPSHRQVGEEYGEMILRVLPTFEAKLDFFLAECTMAVPQADMFARVNIIKDKIPQDYRDEIEGMASKFSGRCDRIGDGRVSTNELYIINLLGDVVRPSACSGLSVYGDRSATGSTLVGRALDYYSGTLAKMTGAHAVLNIKNGEKSICSIA